MGTAGDCYVQYGCGLVAPEGWLNFDVSPTLRLQRLALVGGFFRARLAPRFPDAVRLGDIRTGLPVAPGSVSGAYCSHVLEHLSLEDCRRALRNTFTMLRPGGRFRFVMPDLRWYAEAYVRDKGPRGAPTFMRETNLGHEQRPRGMGGMLRTWLGNATHLWMWDYESMAAELAGAGLTQIRRAVFGDCVDQRFNAVEEISRWKDQLGVECIRPG